MNVKKLFLIFFVVLGSHAQNKQLMHGFQEIPQSNFINPAAPLHYDVFVGVPLASQIHVQAGSTGANLYDVFVDDNRSFSDKLRNVVYSMSPNDFFLVNQQLDLFSGGFRLGNRQISDDYLSFGLYQETDVIAYFPRDLAILAYEGNQNNINRVFDFSDLNVSGEVLSVLHVGYSKKMNEKLRLGIRGKIYSSILNIRSTNNTGSFVTNQGINNFLIHRFNLDMRLRTSGLASLLDDDTSEASEDIKQIRKRILFGGNLGLGVDIGLSYTINKQWQLDASLLDLGFIRHGKDIRNYELNGNLIFEGINPIFPESGDNQTAEEYWDEVQEDFETLFDIQETDTKYTTLRPLKFFGSIQYAFGQATFKECNCLAGEEPYQNTLGFQLFAVKRPINPSAAATVSYSRLLANSWRVKATYTVDSFSATNVGLGTSFRLGRLQMYALADNLLQYSNLAKAQNVSLQLGINYVISKK